MKLATLVGSIRAGSLNLHLAKYMQMRYKEQVDLEILDIAGLPHFNQDLELEPPDEVKQFKRGVAAADGVLFVTPEYNYSIPGVLKNAIDWVSRVDKVMVGKPSFIVGASAGMMGTVRAQLHLRDILVAPGVSSTVMLGNDVYVSAAHEKIDETGHLHHEPTIQVLDKAIDKFLKWSKARG